jgi:uncharacterized protein YndB with AHSA1/START domain
MAVTSREMPLPPEAVFAALRDGKGYGDWVVGTRKIRDVDPGFPAPGSRLHYTVGYGPLRKDDETRVLSCEPERSLVLQVQAWPAGSARIAITIEGRGARSLVSIEEHPDAGPGKALHNPLFDLFVKLRNVETLRRLERVAREIATG